MKYAEMGSSISKYDDLELATAEGGLEPLPTGPSSFHQINHFHHQEEDLLSPQKAFSLFPWVYKRSVSSYSLIIL